MHFVDDAAGEDAFELWVAHDFERGAVGWDSFECGDVPNNLFEDESRLEGTASWVGAGIAFDLPTVI